MQSTITLFRSLLLGALAMCLRTRSAFVVSAMGKSETSQKASCGCALRRMHGA